MLRRFIREEDGAVAAIVGLLVVVLVSLAVFAIDVGYWYNVRRQLQAATDAAALAGCSDLINGMSDEVIWETVEEYVEFNAVTPADATVTVIPYGAGGDSDIGEDYVKVTVRMPARSFFAGIFGIQQAPIRAQSRAVIAYALEGKGLVPFALPIVIVDDDTPVEISIGGDVTQLSPESVPEGEQPSYFDGVATYGGAPQDAQTAVSLDVDVLVYNTEGVLSEDIEDCARVVVRHPDFPIEDLWWEDQDPIEERYDGWIGPGETATLHCITPPGTPEPDATIAGPRISNMRLHFAEAVAGSGHWKADFTAPSNVVDRYAMYDVELSVRVEGTRYEFVDAGGGPNAPASTLVVRRSNAPVYRSEVYPSVVTSVGPHMSDARVELQRFEISEDADGPEYVLMIQDGTGAETGNFGAVDFSEIRYPYPTYDQVREGPQTFHFGHTIAGGWSHTIHIDDAIRLYQGVSVGQVEGNTTNNQGLRGRGIVGEYLIEDWIADGKPQTPHLLDVPIIQYLEPQASRSWVRILEFGTFFVESYDIEGQGQDRSVAVTGHFIEYSSPSGSASEEPGPGGVYELTPRLVSEDIDF